MNPTERLYYDDSHLLEFDARVVGLSERDDGAIAVTLDRTAFYPTGGGQPNDTGTLGEARVVDCIDAESEGVLHVIQGPTPEVGDLVHGRIDPLRRMDHLQQHTGQHILSAAFVKLFDAPTKSFRVLEHECEIDVALDNPTDERIEQAIDLANQIIWQNRPVKIKEVTSEEASSLPLRKGPAREGELRVIEISDFDLTPCGGTHALSTGEVGAIATRSWERAKGLTRLQFVAGVRLLNDYRKANKTAVEVAALFSSGREDSPSLVTKLIEENRRLNRRAGELEEVAARAEAVEILKQLGGERQTGVAGSTALVITKVFEDRNGDSLKHLALALIAHPNVVALLGSRDGDTARLIFARPSDARGDMNAVMRKACEIINGRGGGTLNIAQGGGRNPQNIEQAIAVAASSLSES